MCYFAPPPSVIAGDMLYGQKALRPEAVVTITADVDTPDPRWSRLLLDKYGIAVPMAPDTDPPRCSLATKAGQEASES